MDMVIGHFRSMELRHPCQTVLHEARHRYITVVGTLHPYGAACVAMQMDFFTPLLSGLETGKSNRAQPIQPRPSDGAGGLNIGHQQTS